MSINTENTPSRLNQFANAGYFHFAAFLVSPVAVFFAFSFFDNEDSSTFRIIKPTGAFAEALTTGAGVISVLGVLGITALAIYLLVSGVRKFISHRRALATAEADRVITASKDAEDAKALGAAAKDRATRRDTAVLLMRRTEASYSQWMGHYVQLLAYPDFNAFTSAQGRALVEARRDAMRMFAAMKNTDFTGDKIRAARLEETMVRSLERDVEAYSAALREHKMAATLSGHKSLSGVEDELLATVSNAVASLLEDDLNGHQREEAFMAAATALTELRSVPGRKRYADRLAQALSDSGHFGDAARGRGFILPVEALLGV
jgi:hypothetical protein